ncbi:MAG: hypothetical protein ABIP38_00160 [Steroidobacteraceae bacterium]
MQLQLEELLFPVLEMRTNTNHDQKGDRAGTMLQYGQQLQRLDGEAVRYGLMVSVRNDDEKSRNAPYNFMVEAYGILLVTESTLDAEAEAAAVTANGLAIVMGAIRERLADLTSRAPWGRFLINAVNLPAPATISVI